MSVHHALTLMGLSTNPYDLSYSDILFAMQTLLENEESTVALTQTPDVLDRIFRHLSLASREKVRSVCHTWNNLVLAIPLEGQHISDAPGVDHLVLRAHSMWYINPSVIHRCQIPEAFARIIESLGPRSISYNDALLKFITLDNVARICRCIRDRHFAIPQIVEHFRETHPDIAESFVRLSGVAATSYARESRSDLTLKKYKWYTSPNRSPHFRDEYTEMVISYICGNPGKYIPSQMDLLIFICDTSGRKITLCKETLDHYCKIWPELAKEFTRVTSIVEAAEMDDDWRGW